MENFYNDKSKRHVSDAHEIFALFDDKNFIVDASMERGRKSLEFKYTPITLQFCLKVAIQS